MSSWEIDLCGKDGFSGRCSIKILWIVPSCALLILVCCFYIGKRYRNPCAGCRSGLACSRIFLVCGLLVFPVTRTLVSRFICRQILAPADYLFAWSESLCWLSFIWYLCVVPSNSVDSQERVNVTSSLFLCFISSIYDVAWLIRHEPLPPDAYLAAFKTAFLALYFVTLLLPDEVPRPSYSRFRSMHPVLDSESSDARHFSQFFQENEQAEESSALWSAGLISKLFFRWIEPLMERGYHNYIQSVEDLCHLPSTLQGFHVNSKLESYVTSCDTAGSDGSTSSARSPGKGIILMKSLHHCFGIEYYSLGLLKMLSDCLSFAGPLLLNLLVKFLENGTTASFDGYYYVLMLFSGTFLGALCTAHYNYLINKVSLKVRAAIIVSVYHKTLNVSHNVLCTFTTGEVMNFMSSDTDRIVNFCQSFHQFWSLPFQVAVTLFLLYQQIGLSFLVGLGFALILIPINHLIAKRIGLYSKLMMEEKDKRIKLMSEILSGMKVIKMHAWEKIFSDRVDSIRKKEMKYLKKRKYLDAFCVYFWATSPVVITFLSFTVYALSGNTLTASRIFTSLSLFNMLIVPLNAFPWVLNGLVEAYISVKRVQKFLSLPELKLEKYYSKLEDDDTKIKMCNATFTFEKPVNDNEHIEHDDYSRETPDDNREDVFCLGPLDLTIKKGSFVCIVGKVGSGKSTLISAVLGNVRQVSGEVCLHTADWTQGIGLVSQEPWIQKTSVRNNILFGKEMDTNKYIEVLKACALEDDLRILPLGDSTEVGEKGITLSGGQKARIALARAVYQDLEIYLLDDPIAAVDVHVAEHLVNKCILGLLANKTRILCTHRWNCLEKADMVVFLRDRKVLKQGPPRMISQLSAIDFEDNSPSKQCENEMLVPVKDVPLLEDSSVRIQPSDDAANEEEKDSGVVKLSVYKHYWSAIGTCLSLLLLLCCFFMQGTKTLSDWWLSFWISGIGDNSTQYSFHNGSGQNHEYLRVESLGTSSFYLKGYAALAIANNCFTVVRAFLFAYCGIRAASVLHSKLKKHIMKAPVAFFSETPLGRIINRFSSDVYNIDDSLPFMLNILLAQTYSLFGCLAVTLYSLPWLINLFIPLCMIYYSLQHYYRCTSRELKRLSSITLSPIYAHFSETLNGHPTIKALANVSRFKSENMEKLDANQRAMFATAAVAQWLNLRLQFIGVAVVTSIALVALLQNEYGHVEPSLVGLAMSYALLVTGLLNGFVTAFTETEKEMVSVERVMQYIHKVPVESDSGIEQLPFIWPSCGIITFQDVVLQYKDDDPYALNHVNFQTRPAEKIGIVGRTGSGKSSLFQALFRVVDIKEGCITVDDVNIAELNLRTLRKHLSLVPQDPFLFSGTIRQNIDASGSYTDDEVWQALLSCHIDRKVKEIGGLDALVVEKGENFSAGEKQLLCLARILLQKTKVLCLDEATASVDHQTDSLLQLSLRIAFRNTTVLIIAHRIETVMDCDRVIVMSKGRIEEIGEPSVLLRNSSSEFYKLIYKC